MKPSRALLLGALAPLRRSAIISLFRLEGGSEDRLLSSTAKSRGRAMATKQAATERGGMKIKQGIVLIGGITSVALSPIVWAAGHGGGGGRFGGAGLVAGNAKLNTH